MKKTGKWLLSLLSKALIIILVILLLPLARTLIRRIMPDAAGEIRVQSMILEQKLESSKRLEVTTIDEEGILEAKTNVVILGTVGSTTIRYRYTASVGIDLSKVVMTTDSDRIIFELPDPEILNDGIEALEILKTKHVDAIVTDIKMPRMDGLVFLSNIRRLSEYDGTPVVVVSGVYDPDTKEKFINAGAQAFIVKSEFQRGNLLQAVKELLGE